MPKASHIDIIILCIMQCLCIVMHSLSCQLPSCNLFTQHVSYLLWRDTTSELWTPVHSFTLIKQPQTANCFFFILCNLILIFHTIRLILCFQQASEIDNLTVSLGQNSLIVLCRFHCLSCNSSFLAPLLSTWCSSSPFLAPLQLWTTF